MRKISEILMLSILFLILIPFNCAGAEDIIRINDLIENSLTLDKTEVSVQGEAIGETLERGDYVWVNINDTTNAIGIWVKKSDAERISYYGDYKHKGDTVKFSGIFHKACREHGGDVDIHSDNVKIIKAGGIVKEKVPTEKVAVTLSLLLITIIAAGIYYYLKKTKQP